MRLGPQIDEEFQWEQLKYWPGGSVCAFVCMYACMCAYVEGGRSPEIYSDGRNELGSY